MRVKELQAQPDPHGAAMSAAHEKISSVFKHYLQITAIDESSTLADLGADSMDEIDLLMNVEAAFDIEFDFAAWEKCITFADYVSLTEGIVSGKI